MTAIRGHAGSVANPAGARRYGSERGSYPCVVSIDRCPASSCTSRRLQPARCALRAAEVMNVHRPECDEQPTTPSSAKSWTNQLTILFGRIGPRRADWITGPKPPASCLRIVRARRQSGHVETGGAERDGTQRSNFRDTFRLTLEMDTSGDYLLKQGDTSATEAETKATLFVPVAGRAHGI